MATPTTEKWINDDKTRKMFWTGVNGLLESAGLKGKARTDAVHKALCVNSLEDNLVTMARSMQIVAAYLKHKYPGKLSAPGPAEQEVVEIWRERWAAFEESEGATPPPPAETTPTGATGPIETATTVDPSADKTTQVAGLLSRIAALEDDLARVRQERDLANDLTRETLAKLDQQPVATVSHGEPIAVAFTTLLVNGHAIHVTGKHPATPQQIAQTALATLEACRLIYNDERVKSYVPVVEARDAFVPTGEKPFDTSKVTFLPAPWGAKNGASSAPASNGNGSAPKANEDENRGTAVCGKIEVGSAYESGKTQLLFDCENFQNPLKFTKSNLYSIVANVTLGNGEKIRESDIQVGRKFFGQWIVHWSKTTKGDKTYLNVESVEDKR